MGGRPSAKRRAPRRRRWRPAHLAGYGAVVLLLGLALFLVARSAVRSPASTPIAQSAGAIVAYQGDDQLGGHESSLSSVLGQGRPVVLNYFAGACAQCTAEMPGFEKAYESSAGKVLIVGLDVGPFTGLGSHEDAARLLRQLAIRYPAAYAVDDSALRSYGITAMPTTLFFDANGRLVDRSDGALTQRDLEARIQRLEVRAPS